MATKHRVMPAGRRLGCLSAVPGPDGTMQAPCLLHRYRSPGRADLPGVLNERGGTTNPVAEGSVISLPKAESTVRGGVQRIEKVLGEKVRAAKWHAAAGGRWAGMAYGASACIEFGPYAAAGCGLFGAIFGERAVRGLADAVPAMLKESMEARERVFQHIMRMEPEAGTSSCEPRA